MDKTRFFLSLNAQPDNLGDIAIRKVVCDWVLEQDRHQMVVLSNTGGDSYFEGFELARDAPVIRRRSALRFVSELVLHGVSGSVDMAFAPGPQVLSEDIGRRFRSFVNGSLVRIVTLKGGGLYVIGRSYDGSAGRNLRQERAQIGRALLVACRDSNSSSVLGISSDTHFPDLAFTADPVLGAPVPSEREFVAISVRDDTDLSDSDLVRLCKVIRANGYKPLFVSQVRRDNENHERWARACGAEVIEWREQSHGEQMARVRSAYARSRFVFSDRFHGLVFGMTQLAIPIGIAGRASAKLEKSFAGLYDLRILDLRRPDSGKQITPLFLDHEWLSVEALESLQAIKRRLELLRQQFGDSLRRRTKAGRRRGKKIT